jgi:hypothetical protein
MGKILVLLAVLAFAGSAAAQQFKWVDKDGRVQYGDVPPPGAKATRLKPPPAGSAPAPAQPGAKAGAKAPPTPEEAFKKRQQEAQEKGEKAEKERLAADTRKANCSQAQAQLQSIQSGQRVQTINAAGERVFADDAQRAVELQKMQAAVNEWCK